MNAVEIAFADFQNELDNTRKVLERLPEDKLTWKPHEKSMSLGDLADHVARLPFFFETTATADSYDLSGWKQPPSPTTRAEVLQTFDERSKAALESMKQLTPENLMQPWSLKMGDQVFFTLPRAVVLRTFSISHMIHHRAQLNVYYRQVGVPVPGLYGPSADES